MAFIAPFRATVYNPQMISDLSRVMSVPYDQIKGEMQDDYYRMHPYNVVRLILGKIYPTDHPENNRYTRAKETLDHWLEEEILRVLDRPAIFIYDQEFTIPGGERKKRRGFIALIRLEEFEKGIILPHEKTLSKPKADRLELMKATEANLEQIFFLYPDPGLSINSLLEPFTAGRPIVDIVEEYAGTHRVYPVFDTELIRKIQGILADKAIFIADGHHRYETSLAYRNIRRKMYPALREYEPFNFRMATFVNLDDQGLVILPTHRLIRNLEQFDPESFARAAAEMFDIERLPADDSARDRLFLEMKRKGQKKHSFGLFLGAERYFLLTLKDDRILEGLLTERTPVYRNLDVTVLHTLLIERILGITPRRVEEEANIAYVRSADEAIESVKSGEYQLAFFLNPTRVDQVKEIALAHEKIPQKSTDFYPKLLSGLVFYRFADNQTVGS